MSTVTNQRIIPTIALRIPGPWRSQNQIAERLADGCRLEGEQFVLPDGFRVGFEAKAADQVFPGIFKSACRRPAEQEELDGLGKYKMIAAASLPGGSPQAAERILETAAFILRAGGFGVFIDNSVIAHGAADWMELAENRHDRDAVFYAFVSLAKSTKHIASHGMHVLGQPDAVLDHDSKLNAAIDSLEDFLRSCAKGNVSFDSKEFADSRKRQFSLCRETDHNPFGNQHPIHNPFGRWRLNPI